MIDTQFVSTTPRVGQKRIYHFNQYLWKQYWENKKQLQVDYRTDRYCRLDIAKRKFENDQIGRKIELNSVPTSISSQHANSFCK